MATKKKRKRYKHSFTIDRAKWRVGGNAEEVAKLFGNFDTRLLDPKGNMCCIGFCGLSYGLKKVDLLHAGTPQDCKQETWSKWASFLHPKMGYDTNVVDALTDINDDEELSLTEREKKVKSRFARHGVLVKFKGKYPQKVEKYFNNNENKEKSNDNCGCEH